MRDISIIIVTYNCLDVVIGCLNSIAKTKGELDIEIFLIDNASSDGTVDVVMQRFSYINVIANEHNLGFPVANNQAINVCSGRYILLLNPDTVLSVGALQSMFQFMNHDPEYAICGPRLIDRNGCAFEDLRQLTLSVYAMHTLGLRKLLKKHPKPEHVNVVSGACLMIRHSVIDDIGVLDEDLFWCEDMDYCFRATKAGHRVGIIPSISVLHLHGQSARKNVSMVTEKQYTSKLRFFLKHEPKWKAGVVLFLSIFELKVRLLKWQIYFIVKQTKESSERKACYKMIIDMLPKILND